MSIRINSNIAALNAQRRLGESTATLQQSFSRLSSGLRINRAVDDAAGLAVSASLNVDARVLAQGSRNISDGISAVAIASGALEELRNIAIRQKELAEQAANGIYSGKQRDAMDREANALVSEFNRIVESTSFNGRNLLDLSFNNVGIQLGYSRTNNIDISIGSELARLTGDGTFSSQSLIDLGAAPTDVGFADLNGDGITDMYDIGPHFGVSLGNGDGTFKARQTYSAGVNNTAHDAEVADINGDGALDFALVRGNGVAWVSLANGNGTFKAPTSVLTPNVTTFVLALDDFNGDGRADMVTGNQNLSLFLGNGDGTFRFAMTLSELNMTDIRVADFNGDDHLDIAYINANVTNRGYNVLLSNGNGSFLASEYYQFFTGTSSTGLGTGDFNGDGIEDIAVTAGNGFAAVFLGNGNGSFRAAFSGAGLNSPEEIRGGDINGDGYDDFAVLSDAAGGGVYIYLANSDGSFRAPQSFATGASPDDFVLQDINGDRVLDLAVANGGATTISLLLGNTRSVSTIDELDLTSQASAREALDVASETLNRVLEEIGKLGALESRLASASQVLDATRENYITAASQIVDVDAAFEAAKLVRARILQQAGAAVLAQANIQPQLALQLLER